MIVSLWFCDLVFPPVLSGSRSFAGEGRRVVLIGLFELLSDESAALLVLF